MRVHVEKEGLWIKRYILPNVFVKWDDIVGIRDPSFSKILISWQLISSSSPKSTLLFMRNGRSIFIPSTVKISGVDLREYDSKFKNVFGHYYTLIELINDNSPNIQHDISKWIRWRWMMPAYILIPLVAAFAWLYYGSHDEAFKYASISIAPAMLIGVLWEYHARKKYWK